MSDGLIRVSNTSYARYEELLIRKDEVKKLAFQYERAYVREFSSIEEEVLHCDEFDSHDLYESREYYRNNWLIIYQRRNLEKNE